MAMQQSDQDYKTLAPAQQVFEDVKLAEQCLLAAVSTLRKEGQMPLAVDLLDTMKSLALFDYAALERWADEDAAGESSIPTTGKKK